MERKIGESFVYNDKRLKVVKSYSIYCDRCYFRNVACYEIRDLIAECFSDRRIDGNLVEFKLIDKYEG